MYYQKVYCLGLVTITTLTLCGQEAINTYHNQLITPESLLALSPKLDPEAEKCLQTWLYQNQHLIGALTNAPVHGEFDPRLRRRGIIRSFIESCGFKNISKHNYMIPVVCTVKGVKKIYMIVLAGPANRRENYNVILGKQPNTAVKISQYQHLEREGKLDTYQTVSRLAHALRLQEWIEQHPSAPITMAKTYLMHIPAQPADVVDKNYVIIREWIESAGTPEDYPDLFLKHMPEVMDAARYAGLGDISMKQFVITPDQKIAFFDLEQRNNFNSEHFFLKSREEYEKTVQEGVEGFDRIRQQLESIRNETRIARMMKLVVKTLYTKPRGFLDELFSKIRTVIKLNL
jgi:hypothetical protein